MTELKTLADLIDQSAGALKTTATLNTGDIELGAAEIKDGASDNRAAVSADGALSVNIVGATVDGSSVSATPVVMTKTALDGTAAATTTIATSTTGNYFYPIYFRATLTAVDTMTVVPSLSIGTNSTAYNNIVADTALSSLAAAGDTQSVVVTAPVPVSPASTAVKVKVNTGATAVTCTLTLEVFGFYVAA